MNYFNYLGSHSKSKRITKSTAQTTEYQTIIISGELLDHFEPVSAKNDNLIITIPLYIVSVKVTCVSILTFIL